MKISVGRTCYTDGSTQKILIGKPEGTRPPGRLKIRWEDNIFRDSKEEDYENGWKTLAQDRVIQHAYVLAAMNIWVP